MRSNIRAAIAMTGLAAAAALGLAVSPPRIAPATPALATVISHQIAPNVQKLEGPKAAAVPARTIEISQPTSYTVHSGDSLSAISRKVCGHAGRWPNIWKSNRKLVKNPNALTIGWKLSLPGCGRVSFRTRRAALAAIPAPPAPAPAPASAAPASESPAAPAAPVASTTVSTSGVSGFEACVIQRESGGNAQAQNPTSTASGLFGFLSSTWTAVTGLPGPARAYSVATQMAAFAKAYAQMGASPWAAYDGC
jgi:hypothetical protein